jgi:hypothetical protein
MPPSLHCWVQREVVGRPSSRPPHARAAPARSRLPLRPGSGWTGRRWSPIGRVYPEGRPIHFVVVEPKITAADVSRWQQLG